MKQESELKLILSEFIRAVKVCTDHASLLRDSADGIEQYLAEMDVPVRAVPEHAEDVETPSSEEKVQLPDMPQGATVLLIIHRNLGRNPSAPRGHSAIFARADIVAEWHDGRWHIIKGPKV